MKLRSRKIDSNEDTTSSPKKAKLDLFESIFPGMLISYGKYGKCHGSGCDGVPMGTTVSKFTSNRMCRECSKKECEEKDETWRSWEHQFIPSDAKFKCPAYTSEGSCKSRKVSFKDFYLGSCCQPASKWLTENKKGQEIKFKTIRQFIDLLNERRSSATIRVIDQGKDVWKAERELKEEKKKFEKKLENMKKELENFEKSVAREKEALEKATKEVREVDEEKEPHVKRYKQVLYEYHSVATELSVDAGISVAEITRDKCCFCNEYYNDDDRRKTVLANCGHTGCYSCLAPCWRTRECLFVDCKKYVGFHDHRSDIIKIYD